MNQIKLLENTYKFSLYILAFLLPIWFLPFTQDVLNFQKQALLLVLVLVGIVAWLAKALNQGELNFRFTWLHVSVLVLVLAAGVSTLTSVFIYGSFWGWPLNIANSFLTVLFFALLYFLISNAIKENKDIFQLFFLFIASVAIAGVFALLQVYRVFVLPFPFTKSITFNTVGSVNSLAVLSAVLLPLALVMALLTKTILKWFIWLFLLLFFVVLLLINFFTAWIVLTAGLIMLILFGMWNMKKRMEFGWISFPMMLLVLALFFLIFRVPVPGAPVTPIEASPSLEAQTDIAKNILKEKPLFGTGPGTFVYDYSKYRQVSINQTIFWATRFTSGASEVLDWFITKGIFGGLALVSLLITALVFSVLTLLKTTKGDNYSWMLGLGITASFTGMAVAQFIYYSNFTIFFLLWLLLGGLATLIGGSQKKLSLAPPSFLSVVSSFVFLLILVFGVGLLFLGGQKYAAEVQYLKGFRLLAAGDSESGIAKVFSAANLSPSVDIYWRDLSQLYLSQVSRVIADPNLSQSQKLQQNQALVNNAINAANRAVAANPANVENWNVRGFIYRNLIGIQGADTFAVESYNKATSLEPASPFSFAELGRVYLIKAQSLINQKDKEDERKESLDKALESLNKAVSLKVDYAPAHYLIALVYEQQGKSDEAIAKLEGISRAIPNDVGFAFQLAVIYYQKDELAKAQTELERARNLSPDYANARYMLGLVYDRRGQKNRALEEFTKVSELNPDNTEVKHIIANLKAGKNALDGIQPSQPPIQENPPEIQNETNR